MIIQTIIFSLFMFLLGLAMLIYGYRLFMVMLPIWGFFAGFWLGADTTSLILGTGFLGTIAGWVAGFTAGLIFAVLSYLIYAFAAQFVAAVIGYSLGVGVMSAFFGLGLISTATGVALAVIIMFLTLFFSWQKYVVITITSILGANTMLISFLVLFGRISLEDLALIGSGVRVLLIQESWLWLMLILIVAGAGIWRQIRVNQKFKFTREFYVKGWG